MVSLSKVGSADSLDDGRSFDACYYARSCGRPYRRDAEWLEIFDRMAERIAREIEPRSVLDAGCALGLLVETLRERGVDAFGLDLSQYAIEHVSEPIKPFCWRASVAEPFGKRYDLIVSIEVLEHMSPADAETAVANFCAHTDDVLFSSTPFDFDEPTHVNVRPPEYWASQFARWGFYRDVDFDASFITAWAVRFRKRNEPTTRLVFDYERTLSRVAIERNQLRAEALVMQRNLSSVTERLAAASDKVEHMQRSWFWRARRPWAWLSRRLGRPT